MGAAQAAAGKKCCSATPPGAVTTGKRGSHPPGRSGRATAAERNELFEHLYAVSAELLRRGDRRPAEVLWRSYREEAERLRAEKTIRLRTKRCGDGGRPKALSGDRRARIDEAERKAVRLAQLLGKAPSDIAHFPATLQPTAQTVLFIRRQRDPLANMRLSHRQEWAAREIRRIYEALVRSLYVRPRDFRTMVGGDGRGYDPVEFVPEHIAAIRKSRYLPWVATQQHVVACLAARSYPVAAEELRSFNLVIQVLIDRTPLGRLEKRFGVRNGRLGVEFRAALDAYVAIAGRAAGRAG